MKVSLQDFAYQKCQELIQRGELIPGKLYSEVAISKQLNVSRTPLRAAVQRLEKEGVVTRLPQRGFHVNQFDENDIEELFLIRKAMEGFAAEYLATHQNRFDLNSYRRHLDAQKKVSDSDDFSAFVEADRAFHEEMIQALANRRLTAMYADLRQSIALIALRRFKVSRQRDHSLAEHTVIVEAIGRGDPAAAREAVYRHLDSAMTLFKRQKSQAAD